MADVAKEYGIGDTVHVWFENKPRSTRYLPHEKVVESVRVTTGTNEATVRFTDGTSIIDGAVKTVYLTEAACATGIITAVIANTAATVVLEGGAETTLARA